MIQPERPAPRFAHRRFGDEREEMVARNSRYSPLATGGRTSRATDCEAIPTRRAKRMMAFSGSISTAG